MFILSPGEKSQRLAMKLWPEVGGGLKPGLWRNRAGDSVSADFRELSPNIVSSTSNLLILQPL